MIVASILGSIGDAIVGAVVAALNALIAALATVIGALFAALPDLPSLPSPPTAMLTAEAWVAWFFPVSTVVDILVFVLSMWLLWTIVALGLRWAKLLSEDAG